LIRMTNGSAGGAAGDDRIAALERKIKEMEALVKGITEELLDMKSIVMKLSKASEERSRQELKRVQPIVQGAQPQAGGGGPAAGGSTVVMRPKSARTGEPAKPEEPSMDMIMQPDGTMKLEQRRGDKNYIVASAGYGRKKGKEPAKKQSDLIYAADDEKASPAKK
jgi:hypothetical protein